MLGHGDARQGIAETINHPRYGSHFRSSNPSSIANT